MTAIIIITSMFISLVIICIVIYFYNHLSKQELAKECSVINLNYVKKNYPKTFKKLWDYWEDPRMSCLDVLTRFFGKQDMIVLVLYKRAKNWKYEILLGTIASEVKEGFKDNFEAEKAAWDRCFQLSEDMLNK